MTFEFPTSRPVEISERIFSSDVYKLSKSEQFSELQRLLRASQADRIRYRRQIHVLIEFHLAGVAAPLAHIVATKCFWGQADAAMVDEVVFEILDRSRKLLLREVAGETAVAAKLRLLEFKSFFGYCAKVADWSRVFARARDRHTIMQVQHKGKAWRCLATTISYDADAESGGATDAEILLSELAYQDYTREEVDKSWMAEKRDLFEALPLMEQMLLMTRFGDFEDMKELLVLCSRLNLSVVGDLRLIVASLGARVESQGGGRLSWRSIQTAFEIVPLWTASEKTLRLRLSKAISSLGATPSASGGAP